MSSSVTLPSNIGFIGLGNMGLPMFSNLISKLPSTSTVHFYDVSSEAMIKGSNDSRAICHLDPCSNAREVAEKSVSSLSKLKHSSEQPHRT